MTFVALIVKNVVRQKIRTALTVLGIAIGITTVVALGAVVGGLKQTAGAILKAYDSDFIVAQKGSSDLTFSAVSEEELAQVAALPDVERAIGALVHVSQVGGNPYFILIGVEPEDLVDTGPGGALRTHAAIVGGGGDRQPGVVGPRPLGRRYARVR